MPQSTTRLDPTAKPQDAAGEPIIKGVQGAPIDNQRGCSTTVHAQATTWADKVRVSDASTRHTLEPLPQKPAGSRLKIPVGMKMHNMDQWKKCLIGFFIGCKMPYHAVSSIAKKAWKPYGMEQVTTMADGFYVFRFRTEEDIGEVLERGPWMFGGKHIVLQKWSPKFQFDKSRIASILVWIRLRGLPLPLWTKQGLSLAASMVGKPLSCDEPTISCSRLDYARLCIELNASLPFIHQFEIESPLSDEPQLVKVDYEWKPPRCERCQCFGHNCVAKEEQLMKLTQKEDKRPAEQTPSEVKESTNMGNGDQEAKPGKMGQTNEVVDATSHTPQASTSLKQSIDPCRQDKPNGKAPQTSQEASSGSGNAASEIHVKGNWPSEEEEIMSKKKGKAPAITEPTSIHSPEKVKKKKGGKKKHEARGL
ncbi:GLYCINE-RICH CELL WALL STRUCTURAL PROTEIN 1.8-LIKE [Salix viminalis]|uniref:GLYCINE-RICH CELL WALL STRUCTURAL PROTEIN 1.8-LIKE n=1 Tax=Salix viminalis TaxID=40686 RepID=A0A9Q0NPN4_SALVM|nr:GLYCINE-RICH CELL WALL STRUCTURAL PROTEIN 1.8-LIKE [Salix viminalis]